MEVLHKKRPIGWLIDRAAPAIVDTDACGYPLRYACDFAMNPNEVRDKAFEMMEKVRIPVNNREELAKSARWLAIIYRDYGPTVFQQAINLVQIINAGEMRHEKD